MDPGTLSARIRVVRCAALVAAVLASGCFASVARVEAIREDGPIRLDRARPVVVEESGESVTLTVPVFVTTDDSIALVACSFLAGSLPVQDTATAEGRFTVAAIMDRLDAAGVASQDQTVLDVPERQVRALERRFVLPAPTSGARAEADRAGYMVLLDPASQADTSVSGCATAGRNTGSLYLIRRGTVEPIGGSAEAVLGVVAAAILLTLWFGS